MTPEDVARAWISIALQAVDSEPAPFFRFMTAWIALNALYASRHLTVKSERRQVHAFAREPDAVMRHRSLLQANEEYRQSVACIKAPGVFNYRKQKRLQIGDDLNLVDVLNCTYQVRCNLFHGDKFPDDESDKRLVEAAFKITSEIVKAFT